MIYNKFSYIYPPRPTVTMKFKSDTYEKMKTSGWIAQLKLNGQRNCIYLPPDGSVNFMNRHAGGHKSYSLPENIAKEIRSNLNIDHNKWNVIDGELMYRGVTDIKHTIFLWDILVHNGIHLLGSLYRDRYNLLSNSLSNDRKTTEYGLVISEHIWLAINYRPDEWDDKWKLTETTNWVEGFVMKDPNGRLKPGFRQENNDDWHVRCRIETGRHRF